jgi:regulator of sigma E protease
MMDILNALFGAAGSFIGTLVPFLFVLTLVVFIHELGHFLVGRWCGVEVKTFSIGFGTELWGFTDRLGTRWRLAAIPLGGYVKFAGDANGASVPDQTLIESMTEAEKAVSFYHQPVPRRAAIVAAGPVANFLLAIAIFSATIYLQGRQILTPRIDTVQPQSAAARAGFEPDDLVLSIDGTPIKAFADMQRIVGASAGETLAFVVERGGRQVQLIAVPEHKEIVTPFGKQRVGVLGLQASRDPADWRTETYGLVDSLKIGVADTWFVVERTYDYVSKLLRGRESTDQLSGPIRIAQVSGQVASLGGFGALLNLAAVLSVSIGLINLVPIPLLDGGHLMFYAIEALRGRPLSERAQELGFRIGLAIVLMLMLFVTWNDLVHLGASFGFKTT